MPGSAKHQGSLHKRLAGCSWHGIFLLRLCTYAALSPPGISLKNLLQGAVQCSARISATPALHSCAWGAAMTLLQRNCARAAAEAVSASMAESAHYLRMGPAGATSACRLAEHSLGHVHAGSGGPLMCEAQTGKGPEQYPSLLCMRLLQSKPESADVLVTHR